MMLRRSGRNGQIWVRLNPLFADGFATGKSLIPPARRSGKWKPLGARNHVARDPTLFKLSSFLGKPVLMGYVRRATATNPEVVLLAEKWDSLTPAAQRAVTLTDLCHVSSVTPATFIGAAARGCCQAGDRCVLIALQRMWTELPEDVKVAVSKWFAPDGF